MLKFDYRYFILFVVLLIVEIFIAIYIHDGFIRPFVGDLLVVILIYSFVMSFIGSNYIYIAVLTLVFAYIVELGQYYHVIDLLEIDNKIFRIALWNSFDWMDLLAYTVWITIVVLVEKYI